MNASSNRGWKWFSLIGIALWVGLTVVAAVVNDDPSDARPVLLTFAGGGAVFFGLIFGAAWWQTRPKPNPELDALLAELAIEPDLGRHRASQIHGMRRVGRTYIALGALVTALGLAAIVQEALEVGSPETTYFVMVGIVVVWALAVPFVIGRANRVSGSVLSPLGLELSGGAMAGERHGRRVRIDLTAKGWVTRLYGAGGIAPLSGADVLANAGRGDADTWHDVEVSSEDDTLVIRRDGHAGAPWLWDLWLAERLASR